MQTKKRIDVLKKTEDKKSAKIGEHMKNFRTTHKPLFNETVYWKLELIVGNTGSF